MGDCPGRLKEVLAGAAKVRTGELMVLPVLPQVAIRVAEPEVIDEGKTTLPVNAPFWSAERLVDNDV